MKTLVAWICVLPWCLIGPRCPAQGFLNLNFEWADTSGVTPGTTSLPTADAMPYWTAGQGNGQLSTAVSYNGYLATTGGQLGLYDGGPNPWGGGAPDLPSPIGGQFSVFLGAGWGWPGGGEGSGDAFISQTGQVSPGSRSIWFSTSNGGFFPPSWDAPYELSLSLNGQLIPYIEVARNADSLTFAGDIASFAGSAVELQFYLHRLPAAADEAILLGLDDIFFSSEVVPEPTVFTLVGAGMLALLMVRSRRGPST